MTPSTPLPNVDRLTLRASLRVQRMQLDAPARLAAAQSVRHHLAELPAFLAATRIAGYWATNGELPLNLVLASLARRGQIYCLPRIGPGHTMDFVPWQAGDPVEPNRYGIPEPCAGEPLAIRELDVVLLPLLAFDASGNRLGAGGGYYDRALAFLAGRARPAQPLLIGVGYGFQRVERLADAAWDIPLDYAVTEHGLITFPPRIAP
ncbi:MAG TPA: 5-formyltetrahydrofolate cyclo-ligase [Rhodanobacteraceae bacterium]|nr:5-formyltetrahydrofolate cyclo-ligase [Rhodanobacteraceae bacterium]